MVPDLFQKKQLKRLCTGLALKHLRQRTDKLDNREVETSLVLQKLCRLHGAIVIIPKQTKARSPIVSLSLTKLQEGTFGH